MSSTGRSKKFLALSNSAFQVVIDLTVLASYSISLALTNCSLIFPILPFLGYTASLSSFTYSSAFIFG